MLYTAVGTWLHGTELLKISHRPFQDKKIWKSIGLTFRWHENNNKSLFMSRLNKFEIILFFRVFTRYWRIKDHFKTFNKITVSQRQPYLNLSFKNISTLYNLIWKTKVLSKFTNSIVICRYRKLHTSVKVILLNLLMLFNFNLNYVNIFICCLRRLSAQIELFLT